MQNTDSKEVKEMSDNRSSVINNTTENKKFENYIYKRNGFMQVSKT